MSASRLGLCSEHAQPAGSAIEPKVPRAAGFAEYVAVPEGFAYPLPADTDPVETAPLLCAGIIGFRALRRANLPPGGRLGIYGFGSSAHITAQVAMASGAKVYAMTRGELNRTLASELKVEFVGGEAEEPPVPLDAAIVFAPTVTTLSFEDLATGLGELREGRVSGSLVMVP